MTVEDARPTQTSVASKGLSDGGNAKKTDGIHKDELLALSRGDLKRFLATGSDKDEGYCDQVYKLWHQLLQTMRQAWLTDSHLTAVYNAVCVFLQSASQSPSTTIRTFALSADAWSALFDALLASLSNGKLKALRQVLKTLIKILAGQKDRTRARLLEDEILSRTAGAIILGMSGPTYKANIAIFEAFARTVKPNSRVLAAIARRHGLVARDCAYHFRKHGFDQVHLDGMAELHFVDNSLYYFTFALALAIALGEAQAAAGSFALSLMSIVEDSHISLTSLWTLHTAMILRRNPRAIDSFKHYLLVPLFRLYPDQFDNLLQQVMSDNFNGGMLQNALGIIIMGRDARIVTEKDVSLALGCISRARRPIRQIHHECIPTAGISIDLLEQLMANKSSTVQARTYDLLADTNRSIESEKAMLRVVIKHLPLLHGSPDPYQRGQISNITKRLLQHILRERVRQSHTISRLETLSDHSKIHQTTLSFYDCLLARFVDFLLDELSPNCSFPRQVSALTALKVLVDADVPLLGMTDVVNHRQGANDTSESKLNVVWRLLLNPFEKIRSMAASNLKTLSSKSICPGALHEKCDQLRGELSSLLREAQFLASSTGRADHADATGHLLALRTRLGSYDLGTIQSIVLEAKDRLQKSKHMYTIQLAGFSLHGQLIGLRYIIDDMRCLENFSQAFGSEDVRAILDEMLQLCSTIWTDVCGDLCIDSPETSVDEDAAVPGEGPKDRLSYSWRALRDSSLLTQSIIQAVGSTTPRNDNIHQLRKIYSLSFEQLAALRHRGAFSTVARTFSLCCEQLARALSVSDEVKTWQNNALQTLEEQSSKITRRSAGLPRIVIGILMASPVDEFNNTVANLFRMTTSSGSHGQPVSNERRSHLPEVHALNCLREIFTESTLREQTTSWLISALDLSASTLGSKIWAIQNCGLMLFRACTSRIGTSSTEEPGTSMELTPDEATAVLRIANELLSTKETEIESSQLIFAGLDLIGRIAFPLARRQRTKEAVQAHLGSRIWLVRQHAARIYASQIAGPDALDAAIDTVSRKEVGNQNKWHGFLLCALEILRQHKEALLLCAPASGAILGQALHDVKATIQEYAAPAVQSTFVEILNKSTPLWHQHSFQLASFPSQHFSCWGNCLNCTEALAAQCHPPRACDPILRTSAAVNLCKAMLASCQGHSCELSKVFEEVASHDLDSAAALLREVGKLDRTGYHYRGCLLRLYISIIQGQSDETVLVSALRELATLLDDVPEGEKISGAGDELQRVISTVATSSSCEGRELFNVKISALGCLLSYTLSQGEPQHSSLASRAIKTWMAMLEDSTYEAVDVWARLKAVQSLRSFRVRLKGPLPVEDKIALYLILYDFLNDDDEEIRSVAASTASFVFLPQPAGPIGELSPPAACYRLSAHMCGLFGSHHVFHLVAFGRVMLPDRLETKTYEYFAEMVSRYSTEKQLTQASAISYELFEEEKQNLYVDDLREIEMWAAMLRLLDPHSIDWRLRDLAVRWTLDGLGMLSGALSALGAGPFSVLHKLEVIAVVLRILKMSSLLLQWYKHVEGNLGEQHIASIQKELQKLLHGSYDIGLHHRLRTALAECREWIQAM